MNTISLLPQPSNGFPNFTWARTKSYDFKTFAFIISKQVWAGAIFKEVKHPRQERSLPYRNKENFIEKSTIELDYDDGLMLTEALSVLSPYKHIIGTTKSHQLPKTIILFETAVEQEASRKIIQEILSIDGFINTKYNQKGSKVEIRSRAGFEVEPFLPRLREICESNGAKVIEIKHEPPRDRFRVVLFLEQTITDQNKHRPTIEEFLKTVGLPEPDPASYNPVCFFYPFNEVFSTEENGLLVPISEPKEPPKEYVRKAIKAGQKGQLRRSTQNFLIQGLEVGAAEGTFYRTFIASCFDLAENNYSVDEAIELLRKVPHTKEYSHHKFEDKYLAEVERIFNKVEPMIEGDSRG